MILDCEQTVLCMPLFVPWVDRDFLVIPDQIVPWLCGLEGCCSQLLCQLCSLSDVFWSHQTVLLKGV